MVGVSLYWLHQWNNFVDPGRTESTFAFLCVWHLAFLEGVCYWRSIQCKVIISHSFPALHTMVLIGVHLYWVTSMERSRWSWTNRAYVCIPVYLTLKVLLAFDPVQCHTLSLMPCTAMGPIGVRLYWLYQWNNFVAGRIESTFVFLCDWYWRCYWRSIQCKVIISHSFPGLRWCWSAFICNGLHRWNDLVGCGQTGRTFVPLCLTLKLFWGFDPVWDPHHITLILFQNMLQWRWWVCVESMEQFRCLDE